MAPGDEVGVTQSGEVPQFVLTHSGPGRLDPPPQHAYWRQENPVRRVRLQGVSPDPWVVTGYEATRTVLGDARFSSDQARPGFPLTPGQVTQPEGVLTNLDPPRHDVLRRTLTREFMVKRVDRLRPAVERLVDELLDEVVELGGPLDLVERFNLPLPSLVICELLGVPYSEHGFFQRHSKALVDLLSTPQQVREAFVTLRDFIEHLVVEKQTAAEDDVLSVLGTKVTQGAVTLREASGLGAFLLLAGHETTANMLGLSTLTMLRHPEQLPLLLSGGQPTADAVEELLRFLSIISAGLRRVATEDMEVAGVRIAAGEGVIVALPAANRDAEPFPEPDRLDLTRPARRHVAFGFGVHQCLGQPLARAELQIALPALFRRLPGLKLAVPEEELEFKDEAAVYGLGALPVTW
jgi:cytochrome P450